MIVKKRKSNLGNGERGGANWVPDNYAQDALNPIQMDTPEQQNLLDQRLQNIVSQKYPISPILWLGIAGFAYMLFTSKK